MRAKPAFPLPPEFPPEVPLEVRESPRARRLRIEVRPGVVRLTLPRRCPPAEAERFLAERADWVRRLTEGWRTLALPGEGPVDPPIPEVDGAARHLVFRGRRTPFQARHTRKGRPRVHWDARDGVVLHLPDRWSGETREARGRRALARWYDELLGLEAEEVIERMGRPRGLVPDAIRFSQPRTRWGSCASNGVVRLNRRLVGAPAPVFRYVVIHEIAHLRHPDHSPRFWGLVEEMEPAWKAHRRWLRDHGVALG